MSSDSSGAALVRSLSTANDPDSLTALIVEAGRMKDRLDKLDRLLSDPGGFWLEVVEEKSGDRLVVVVDRVLAESRQLATVFRQTLAEIARQQSDGEDKGGDSDDGFPDWL